MALIRRYSLKTGIPIKQLLGWLGLREGKFYEWSGRIFHPNRHNGKTPRKHWITDDEKEKILAYQAQHPEEGYRVLTYMMMDDEVVAVSPSTTYRVLSAAGRLQKWSTQSSKKGTGFDQPTKPHEHWHIDISYGNVLGTFYYLIAVLDGDSRFILNWELRESMTADDVEIALQRANEKTGRAGERLISDNGRQFIAKDFRNLLRLKGMKQVRTTPLLSSIQRKTGACPQNY